ncbi:hypothetical protein SORBI_3010G141700 [Sorghum bicolor]|uniref:Protein FAR1-RELATED SEQUENCE n=1 Tax=Sorghum bicolor TaxID=4558 RepID=C5Z2Z9_SORBI|nr:hypothetical protein SORBI_3010G141700 [Sorghum bicolor]
MATPMPNGTATSNSSPSPCLPPARLVTVTPLQSVSPATMVTPDKDKTALGFYKPGEERVKEKMSMRCGCKAFVKVKWNIKKGYWFFERIRLEHSHPLHPSPSLTQYMKAHKDKEPTIMGIVDQMQRCDVPLNATVNVLSDIYGGRQNFTFTEMDLKNRKAAAAKAERENDIPKLLEFFSEMKAQNEYFYYEVQDEQADTFEWLFKSFQKCMSGSRDPRCILTDQDPAMALAISRVFKKTQHRLCRWHMLNKYRNELKKLYKLHEGLKIKLLTVINHPLTPVEFEAAWNALVDEYGIREDEAIQGLWQNRHLWVAAYLKPLYCGRMTSTQRSESVNKMLKSRHFTGHMTCISKFARKMLEFIQHTNHTAAGETHWSQAYNFRVTLQRFDGHLSRVYTRAVFKKYRDTYVYSTAFRIDPDADNIDSFLVTHTNQSWQYAWFQHSFKVQANVREEYIKKRYTRDPRMMVTWDRNDIMNLGEDCEDERYNTKKLVEVAMMAVRALRKTKTGVKRGCDDFLALAEWGESIARDTGATLNGDTGNDGVAANIEREERQVPTFGEGEETETGLDHELISECAPREALTKGRKHGGKRLERDETCIKKSGGTRNCSHCGLKGHYITGCPTNLDNASKKRGGTCSLRGKMGRKRGRPSTKRQLDDEFDEVA